MTRRRLAILHAAALIVPNPERTAWLEEWTSELWHVETTNPAQATAFCLGAFHDALWLRRNGPPLDLSAIFHVRSPLRCLLLLAILAALTIFSTWHLIPEQLISLHLQVFVSALLILPVTTSLRLGEYPSTRTLGRWAFLAAKIALLLPIVFCGCLNILPPIQPHGFLVGYILAFRWALVDQRQRCPVCLRSLSNPIRIGAPSQTFLAWYGTELICTQGHGLLYVPEIMTSCYSEQRWQHLDPSWNGLFLERHQGM